jgi:flagellar hook protein FlgE
MLQALLSGVASIKAQQTAMNVIGNNLANINTTAYKGSSVTFEDLVSQTISGATAPSSAFGGRNPIQYGLGVRVGTTQTDATQGSLNSTNRPTDLAIQGNGYFMTTDGTVTSYTRDGSFGLDASGNLVQASTGQKVEGWTADALGNIDSTQPITNASTINIPLGSLNAVQVTQKMDLAGNLNGSAAPSDTWTCQIQVYDQLGTAHDLSVQFTNHQAPPAAVPAPPANAASSWDYNIYEGSVAPGNLIGSSSTGTNTPLYFDANGQAINNLAAGTFNTVTVPASGSASAFTINMDFSGVGQLSTASSVEVKDQNGYPPGSLQGFSIGNDGVITGLFTNGLTRALGQIATAIFPNPEGLSRIGSNLWQPTNNSGIAVVGAANTGGRGSISAGYLEQSNVDISNEFSNMIVTQRGYEANTKVVTTVDEMLQDVINMKH